jgi:hypothetical protein
MRRLVVPLLILGAAQWAALFWWRYVDGVTVDVSFGVVFHELLGMTPRAAWEPAQRVLSVMLDMTPGTASLLVACYLIGRLLLGDIVVKRVRQRHLERQRQGMATATRLGRRGARGQAR